MSEIIVPFTFSREYRRKVLERVDLAELLTSIGFEDVDDSKLTYKGLCIFHDDVNTKSFSADLDKKIFHCFGCGAGGDAIDLYALWKKVSKEEAAKVLLEGTIVRSTAHLKIRQSSVLPSRRARLFEWFISKLDRESKYSDYLLYRNLHYSTISNAGIKFLPLDYSTLVQQMLALDSKEVWVEVGLLTEAGELRLANHPIIFPFYIDIDRCKPLFLQGRSLLQEGLRYLSVKTNGDPIPCFFNHPVVSKAKRLFICEGPIDTLSLIEMGEPNAVGIPGAGTLRLSWFDTFRGNEVVLCFDNDTAGKIAKEKYTPLLQQKGYKVLELYIEGKDINKMLGQYCSIIK